MATIKLKPSFTPNKFDIEAWQKDKVICGIDEVGRGSLVGPVVTSAVIIKPYCEHKLLQDSKTLSKEELSIAYQWLIQNSIFSTSIINHRVIDKINIYQATLKAMKRTLMQLLTICQQKPSYVLVDAMPLNIKDDEIEVIYFSSGERLSKSIAAASIIAKVTRDAIMDRYSQLFTEYQLHKNKGYGTPEHQNILTSTGISIIHRKSFLNFINKHDFNDQQSLF